MTKAVVVIDLQKCFLPGGGLATENNRNKKFGVDALGKSTSEFINNTDFQHIFVSKDWHTPGHSSFASSLPVENNARKNGKKVGLYADRQFTNPRYWGDDKGRLDQILWNDHCVQGTDEINLADSFQLNENKQMMVRTIIKGFTQDTDSYSIVADALGNFTPREYDPANSTKKSRFIDILKDSDITEIYITGIARNVCVYWSALDLLNYWILPAYKNGKIIKLFFMFDLTRPVAENFTITPGEIEKAVKDLITNMDLGPEVYNQVFEIVRTPYGPATNPSITGGRRKRATRNMRNTRNMKKKLTKKVTRSKNRSLMTNKNCNCGKNHMKRRQC